MTWKSRTAQLFAHVACCTICIPLCSLAELCPEAGGWVDTMHDRRILSATKPLWRAPVEDGIDAFDVEMRNGAKGHVSVSNGAVRIIKSNDCGMIVVKPKEPFKVERGRQVMASAKVSCTNAEPLRSYGALKIFGPKESLGITGLDRRNFGARGPRVGTLVNTPSGTSENKFVQYQAWGHDGIATPAIVVGDTKSESVWTDWLIEDMPAASKEWNRVVKRTKARDRADEAMPEEDFERALAAEPDHTAKVEIRGGEPRLVVDGEVVPPVMFKGRNLGFAEDNGRYVFAGRRMEKDAGIDIQVVLLPGAKTHNYPNGAWTKDGYDAKGAVEAVKTAFRISPGSRFILSVPMMHYREFGERHPDEVMRTKDGRMMYGNESRIYGTAASFAEIPSNRWTWASYSSESFLAEGRRVLSSVVAELKRTGMSKRVVGFHLCGFRDWQFGTPNDIDFSTASQDAYRRRGDGMDYIEFVQREPTHVQNEFARHLKTAMGKDVITMRWCFSAFSGEYTGSYDIGAFVESDSLDMLVAQPMYINRGLGVPLGVRLPLASFRRHGKIFVNEFDLRTELSLAECGRSEADAVGLGIAKGLDMWQSIFRRAAGQMMANGSGWWFYDMAGGWYESAGIAADIATVNGAYRDMLAAETNAADVAWRPGMAVLIDEQGSLASIADEGWQIEREGGRLLTNAGLVRLPGMREHGRDFNQYHVVLASSGVPYDQFLVADALDDPSLLDRYRMVVWYGLWKGGDAKRQSLLKRIKTRGTRLVLHEELMDISGQALFCEARKAGTYVPCDRYGLQVDMNGRFVSVHGLIPGRYEFMLPFAAKVENVKTGKHEKVSGDAFPIDVNAGETRWYRLVR